MSTTDPPEHPPAERANEPSARRAERTSALGARTRDMLISMAILLPIIGAFALLGRACSFAPLGPTVDSSSVRDVEVHPVLVAAAPRVTFPIREPVLPPGWKPTAVDQRMAPGKASAIRISYLTDGGRYLRLVQTSAEEGALVVDETGGPPKGASPLSAAGAEWVRYTGANDEPAWTRRADGVQWLITGSGQDPEFRTLADAVSAAVPF